MKSIKVAIIQANDSVAIMSFLILGRGNILPFGAQWADKDEAIWMREATPENIDHEISRIAFIEKPIKGYRIIDDTEVPADRTFREAWTDTGKIEIDMPKAKEVHRNKIRAVRADKLMQLDGEWMRATGQNKKQEADDIEAQRQILRDLPADPRIEAATTPEELKAFWPEELM